MAKGTTKSIIDKQLERDGIPMDEGPEDNSPVYRVMGDAKIPVSKHMGAVWKVRKDQALALRADKQTCWDEAIRYYENDQGTHRQSRENTSGNTPYSQRLNEQWTETENVVFANACIMVPLLYPKNPRVTYTYDSDVQQPLMKACERMGNRLMEMRQSPGVNFKPKLRRTILSALLTNAGYLKLSWVFKQDSSSAAVQQLEQLAQQLANAKSTKEIREIEGKLMAMEEKIALLSDEGPMLQFRLPQQIIVDPTSQDPDPSVDANWMGEWDYLPTAYLKAVYGNADGSSVFEPTHVLLSTSSSASALEDEVNNFHLIKDGDKHNPQAYGYETVEQLRACEYTKVWYIWDKTTRRVYMFCDNSWKYPVWVWNDPLKLPRFFPYFKLWFHESLVSPEAKGEVSYYLDQQDAINEINDELRRARRWVRRNVFFNKNLISQEDVESVLKGPDGTARGLDLEEGVKIEDAIFSVKPPSINFPELFNTESRLQIINRITGINDAQRGAQFKTNTTNKAIDFYSQNIEIRVEERKDLIEEFVADVVWNMTMLCLMNWGPTDVAGIIGTELSNGWRQILDPKEFAYTFQPQIEAGSTEKPNTSTRKQQALELGQVLGQFANASPYMVVVLMKMMHRAFPEVEITDEDWRMLKETMMMNLQKAGSGPGAAGQPPQEGQQGEPSDEALKARLKEEISNLPPEAQAQLQELVQQGVPPAEALQQVQGQ